jgi:hypothetical protein
LGCGMPWGTDGGTTFLTQIQNILQGTPGNPGLGWTVPNVHARLVKSDFLNQLQTHDLFFIFTHGLTPKSNPAIPYLVSFQFFNSVNPDDHVQAEVVPSDISGKIGNNHPELVFMDACFSADQTAGSAANVNAPNNFVTDFQANAYVGWAHGQFDWVGTLDARAFFNALKQHNSIQNAANAALNGSLIRGVPLLVEGDPNKISKTIIDKGSQ